MRDHSIVRTARISIALCVTFFIAAGCAFIPLAGIQNDEALFAPAIFPETCGYNDGWIAWRQWEVPVMLMSYVGALKAWLYGAVFAVWAPSVWSVRMPVLLIAAAALAISARIAWMLAGPVAAAVVAALLATDSVYLLTAVFDWGPVALQHFLMSLAIWQLLRFDRGGSRWALAAGWFFIGLAFWNKAIVVWSVTGLLVAAIIFARPMLARMLRGRNAMIVSGALLLGAFPLIVYNVRHPLQTYTENVHRTDTEFQLRNRVEVLRVTANGSTLFGYLFNEVGERGLRESLGVPATAVGLVLAGTQGLFIAAAALVSWLFMVVSAGGGAGHHTVLLWPLPQLAIASAAARWWRHRLVVLAAVALVLGSNLAVMQRYWRSAHSNGGGRGWSQSLTTLSNRLGDLGDRPVFMADWGLHNNMCLLTPGLRSGEISAEPPIDEMNRIVTEPDAVMVRSLGDQRFLPETADRVMSHAPKAGRKATLLASVVDERGQPAYEVLEFVPLPLKSIWQIDVMVPGRRVSAPYQLISSEQGDWNPHFSPDGSQIVFESLRGRTRQNWVANADGSRSFQLTFLENALAGTPRWSPDAKRIAFDSTEGEIYVVGSKGGTAVNFTSHPSRDTVPNWSRDSKWVYFSSDRSGSREIWKAPLDGGPAAQVTREGGEVVYESPEGAWIYYTKPQPKAGLWKMRAEGGPETRVLDSVDYRAFHPRPEGIYYLAGVQPTTLRYLDLATGANRPLANLGDVHNGFSVSRDGRRIIYSRVQPGR